MGGTDSKKICPGRACAALVLAVRTWSESVICLHSPPSPYPYTPGAVVCVPAISHERMMKRKKYNERSFKENEDFVNLFKYKYLMCKTKFISVIRVWKKLESFV